VTYVALHYVLNREVFTLIYLLFLIINNVIVMNLTNMLPIKNDR